MTDPTALTDTNTATTHDEEGSTDSEAVNESPTQELTDPKLPQEVTDSDNFEKQKVKQPYSLTKDSWWAALRGVEITDRQQQIRARPWFAWGIGVLLVAQNIGIWFVVVWALHARQLADLQLIFSTLIAGSLTQSYFLLRLITERVFGDIDYHNGDNNDD